MGPGWSPGVRRTQSGAPGPPTDPSVAVPAAEEQGDGNSAVDTDNEAPPRWGTRSAWPVGHRVIRPCYRVERVKMVPLRARPDPAVLKIALWTIIRSGPMVLQADTTRARCCAAPRGRGQPAGRGDAGGEPLAMCRTWKLSWPEPINRSHTLGSVPAARARPRHTA